MPDDRDRDPGDAVPPGVAVKHPAPLTEQDRKVKRALEEIGPGKQEGGQAGTDEATEVD